MEVDKEEQLDYHNLQRDLYVKLISPSLADFDR